MAFDAAKDATMLAAAKETAKACEIKDLQANLFKDEGCSKKDEERTKKHSKVPKDY